MELPRRPEDVPAAVDDALLRAVLLDGRPPAVTGGRAETILWVHGLGHDAWDFGPVVERHRRAGDAVPAARTLDMPGFGPGLLDAPPTPTSMQRLVDAIVAAASNCPRPPIVAASSLGGHVALLAALAHPELFAGLSLLAPGGLVEVPKATQLVLNSYYSVDAILHRKDDDIVRNSRRIFVRPMPTSDLLATRKLCWHRATPTMKERFAVPFASIVPDVWGHYLGDVVHRLKGLPMQVIFGEGDVVVPLSSGRLLERACGARLSILRGVGHTPHLEDPDTTWQLVRAFADDVFIAAGPHASTPPTTTTSTTSTTTTTTTQTKGV